MLEEFLKVEKSLLTDQVDKDSDTDDLVTNQKILKCINKRAMPVNGSSFFILLVYMPFLQVNTDAFSYVITGPLQNHIKFMKTLLLFTEFSY